MGVSVFGLTMRSLRERAGISVPEFAGELGVTENTVINIEAGYIEADEELIDRVAGFFDVSPDYLTGKIGGTPAVCLSDFFEETCVYKESDVGLDRLHEEHSVGKIKVALFDNRDKRIAMRVESNDMKNSRIEEDDIAIIKVQSSARDGDIVVIRHQEKILIRRFYRRGDTVHLFADPVGRKIPEITYKVGDDDYKIIGKIVTCAITF